MAIPFIIIIFFITFLALIASVPLNGYLSSKLIMFSYDKRYQHHQMVHSPFEYYDLFGALCLFLIGFGWGAIMNVEQDYIHGRYRAARTLLAYSAQALVSLALAVLAIIPSILLTSKACIYTALNMFFATSLQSATNEHARYLFQLNAQNFAGYSPYAITGMLFFMGAVYIQTTTLCIAMVRNAFQALLHPWRPMILAHPRALFILFMLPLVFCVLFYKFFFSLSIHFIASLIELFSAIIGK